MRRRRVTYTWHLRQVMAAHGLWQTTELAPLLAERGVELSAAQGMFSRASWNCSRAAECGSTALVGLIVLPFLLGLGGVGDRDRIPGKLPAG